MKGPGGGPQVRFRNGPADVFREWHAEAKIDRQQQRYCLSGAQAIRRRTLYRLRAIMWPWNNIKMLQWCGTLRARSMCALRPPEHGMSTQYEPYATITSCVGWTHAGDIQSRLSD
ncbi:hypothetical protein CABS01_08837 [Colletotrichum abscissum]|uniref:uncharacterized protein n=1 Tax=Colletotrichum abscissum TaxID=1671311 RepID=UPI0027D725DB|nr:uncharacterized protein CABS01_08837 [Colletotrichum abscissum]KAK1505059.1 hypothetical protein CABS01_08837 [Colletotrichum abscissum]